MRAQRCKGRLWLGTGKVELGGALFQSTSRSRRPQSRTLRFGKANRSLAQVNAIGSNWEGDAAQGTRVRSGPQINQDRTEIANSQSGYQEPTLDTFSRQAFKAGRASRPRSEVIQPAVWVDTTTEQALSGSQAKQGIGSSAQASHTSGWNGQGAKPLNLQSSLENDASAIVNSNSRSNAGFQRQRKTSAQPQPFVSEIRRDASDSAQGDARQSASQPAENGPNWAASRDSRWRGGSPYGSLNHDQGQDEARGNQYGISEEQPVTSGRSQDQHATPFRNIFRGRNLQFWSRRKGQADAQKQNPAANRQERGSVDDWAANEMLSQEEDDGWGGSYIRKANQTASSQMQTQLPNTETDRQSVQGTGSESFSANRGRSRYNRRPSWDDIDWEEEVEAGRSNGPLQGSQDYVDESQNAKTPSSEKQMRGILEAEVLDGVDDWAAPEEDWDEEGALPDITPLAPEEADELLPIIPTPEQMGQSWGGAIDFGQRAAVALVLTVIVAKFDLVLLATGSATSVFWGPVIGAANRNRVLRGSGRYVGLWRASVLAVQVEMPERRTYGNRQSYTPVRGTPKLSLMVGDSSGARSQLLLPYNRRYEGIQLGEAAEVLVLSPKSGFSNFKALKEVYLPESGLWLSDYPHVNRDLFLEISLEIERERKMSMAKGTQEVPV